MGKTVSSCDCFRASMLHRADGISNVGVCHVAALSSCIGLLLRLRLRIRRPFVVVAVWAVPWRPLVHLSYDNVALVLRPRLLVVVVQVAAFGEETFSGVGLPQQPFASPLGELIQGV